MKRRKAANALCVRKATPSTTTTKWQAARVVALCDRKRHQTTRRMTTIKTNTMVKDISISEVSEF